jgi:predicted ATPase
MRSSMGVFVGRGRGREREIEIEILEGTLIGASAATGKLVLVSGEPGIGKTRLAEELTRRAEAKGFVVAWGRSWEGEGTPAYFPWRQALRRLASSFPRKHPGDPWRSTLAMPLGIREAIRAHVALLSPPTQRILEVASVLGREFSVARVEALASDVRAGVDEAIAAGILLGESPNESRARFTHVLIREELYARIHPDRRKELHRAVAAHEHDPTMATHHWIAGRNARRRRAREVAARRNGKAGGPRPHGTICERGKAAADLHARARRRDVEHDVGHAPAPAQGHQRPHLSRRAGAFTMP